MKEFTNLSLNQFRFHGYAAFSSHLILDTGLACCGKTATSPQKQLPRPFGLNPQKTLNNYGFLRLNYRFCTVYFYLKKKTGFVRVLL